MRQSPALCKQSAGTKNPAYGATMPGQAKTTAVYRITEREIPVQVRNLAISSYYNI
jgi:hypothetical protein